MGQHFARRSPALLPEIIPLIIAYEPHSWLLVDRLCFELAADQIITAIAARPLVPYTEVDEPIRYFRRGALPLTTRNYRTWTALKWYALWLTTFRPAWVEHQAVLLASAKLGGHEDGLPDDPAILCRLATVPDCWTVYAFRRRAVYCRELPIALRRQAARAVGRIYFADVYRHRATVIPRDILPYVDVSIHFDLETVCRFNLWIDVMRLVRVNQLSAVDMFRRLLIPILEFGVTNQAYVAEVRQFGCELVKFVPTSEIDQSPFGNQIRCYMLGEWWRFA